MRDFDDFDDFTPLLRRTRLYHLEDPTHFLRRLLEDNGVGDDLVKPLLRRHGIESRRDMETARVRLAEVLSGRPAGTFEKIRLRAQPLTDFDYPTRYACRLCTGGLQIPRSATTKGPFAYGTTCGSVHSRSRPSSSGCYPRSSTPINSIDAKQSRRR